MKKPLIAIAGLLVVALFWSTRRTVRQMERDAALWAAATDHVPSRLADDQQRADSAI